MRIHLPALGPDLPVHPFTGLTAIGLRRNGQPIWPVKGGAPDDDSGTGDDDGETGDGDSDDQGDGDADDLRDAGKKALDTMKGQRNKARADLRPWTALARELGVKTPDEVKALLAKRKPGGDGGDDQVDPEQIRREARAEAQRETLNDRVLDKIEAKARRFADPADAAALLLREHGVDDFLDGSRIDGDAIAEALDDLLERKPYLAVKAAEPERKGPKPDRSQGNRGGAKPTSADRATKRLERLGIRKPAGT
ncbi:hypothetical protein [Micromonospora sp. S-DT3-3-22]|uniref:hypothetical protein n=1 Tax=Micromonospora sp. S-DT3-3-22 TaxID=2755359 RepID=UPI00188F40E6|nr:hypothetical protein [Micromonospora sp. S-DT3-3-22]